MPSEVGIADAVARHLNTLPVVEVPVLVQFVPKRSHEELVENICVTVVPKTESESRSSRYTWDHSYTVDLAVQRYVKGEHGLDASRIRACLAAGRRIKNALKKANDRFDGAVLDSVETIALWNPEHLADKSVFTAVYSFTFVADDDFTDDC